MNMSLNKLNPLLCLICLISLVSFSASAVTVSDLQHQKMLTIETWLSSEADSNRAERNQASQQSDSAKGEALLTTVVGEQITLNIKLGTNRWFTRGTQIDNIELPNVMSKQREQFSVNSTQRINGETWSFQLWQISLYPQAPGRYQVPELGLSVEVMTPSDGKVSGKLVSQAQLFESIIPDASLPDDNWFSSPDVNIEQQWQQSNSPVYVGDSLTRTVTIKAADTLSVLIGDIIPQTANEQFQTYSDPVQLFDSEQRGDYLSTRIEQQVYIVQQGGELIFDDVVIRWWDTVNKEMKQQVLEGKVVIVKHTLTSWLKYYRNTLIVMTCLVIGLISLFLAMARYYQSHQKPIGWLYLQAVKAKTWPKVRRLLYYKVRQSNQKLKLFDGVKQQNQNLAVNIQQLDPSKANSKPLTKRSAYTLWFAVKTDEKKPQSRLIRRFLTKVFPKALPQLTKYSNQDPESK